MNPSGEGATQAGRDRNTKSSKVFLVNSVQISRTGREPARFHSVAFWFMKD